MPLWEILFEFLSDENQPNDQRTGTRQPQAGVPSFVIAICRGNLHRLWSQQEEDTPAGPLCLTGLESIAKLADYL